MHDVLGPLDLIWLRLRDEAGALAATEPVLAELAQRAVLAHAGLAEGIAARVASELDHPAVPAAVLERVFRDALAAAPAILQAVRADLFAVVDRDPASPRMLQPYLFHKGFAALQAHRLAHWLWHHGRRDLASYLQSRVSRALAVDIHPAARFGRGIMLDHGTGLVVGETAVVGDDVSILQGVTLGGTGKEHGDRHPKVGSHVMIGAGAIVLGNIEIGAGARIAAGSVVLRPVPPHKTVAGVPARVVGDAGADPATSMDQLFDPAI